MKVLLVNGSPHREGCTFTALSEVGKALEGAGIATGTFWIGVKPLSGCIACKTCVSKHKCVRIWRGCRPCASWARIWPSS